MCFAVPIVLSVSYFSLKVWRFIRGGRFVVSRTPYSLLSLLARALKPWNKITCLSAVLKAFSKPLVMLDFSGGKTRLENVCPYCNHVLGSVEIEVGKEDVGVFGLEKKEVEH